MKNKMAKEKIKKGLPKWFNGDVYEDGAEVANRFTGHTCELDAEELSMYDFVMGSSMFIELNFPDGFMDPASAKIQNEMAKGLSWFRQRNPSAYMILLD
jgi:hypothetical protein